MARKFVTCLLTVTPLSPKVGKVLVLGRLTGWFPLPHLELECAEQDRICELLCMPVLTYLRDV